MTLRLGPEVLLEEVQRRADVQHVNVDVLRATNEKQAIKSVRKELPYHPGRKEGPAQPGESLDAEATSPRTSRTR